MPQTITIPNCPCCDITPPLDCSCVAMPLEWVVTLSGIASYGEGGCSDCFPMNGTHVLRYLPVGGGGQGDCFWVSSPAASLGSPRFWVNPTVGLAYCQGAVLTLSLHRFIDSAPVAPGTYAVLSLGGTSNVGPVSYIKPMSSWNCLGNNVMEWNPLVLDQLDQARPVSAVLPYSDYVANPSIPSAIYPFGRSPAYVFCAGYPANVLIQPFQ